MESPSEVSADMIDAGVGVYREMALYDDRSWYSPREIVEAVIRAALSERSIRPVRSLDQSASHEPHADDQRTS